MGSRQEGTILERERPAATCSIDVDHCRSLVDASKVGSGDDITLGLLVREEALATAGRKLAERRASDGGDKKTPDNPAEKAEAKPEAKPEAKIEKKPDPSVDKDEAAKR